MTPITESLLEDTCLAWFSDLGWSVLHGPDIAPDMPDAERSDYRQVILIDRLREALIRINATVPAIGIEDAIRKIVATESPDLVVNNRAFHRFLTDGVDVEVMDNDGANGLRHVKVWLLDLDDIHNNDWLTVNQFTVIEENHERRPDIVLFVNGLPLVVIELKNPAKDVDEKNPKKAVRPAFRQIETYKREIPALFTSNELVVLSDGFIALAGTITSGWDRFMPWRTIDGKDIAPVTVPNLEVLIRGLFEKSRFLDYVLNFIVFQDDGADILKKAAAYHQYWAVNKALSCTFSACGIHGDESRLIGRFPEEVPGWVNEMPHGYKLDADHFGGHRIGVVWHTQGSGKSLSMVFYSGKAIRHPDMGNPTIVVITDRNDLDDQLFGTFAGCKDLLRQSPVQAGSRSHLRDLLKVASGGVVFSTIQKFMPDQTEKVYPVLSDRSNVVVIADEAHRSQYDFIDGLARNLHDALPNASFIGFTGTPIERDDRSTPAVFGNYIDTYDILRAVEDWTTVPIYYESRLARIELDETEKPVIDPEFDAITEGEEEQERHRLRTRWAALEAMVGAEKRIALVAEDLAKHFENRLEVLEGKALIVCMSRRICVDMYAAIQKIRPEWHDGDDTKGMMKVVMSGNATDEADWQMHIRNKEGREAMAKRFKDPDDPLKIVIVRDMWLTGFDCPSLHTMYVDKPMAGHNLMQAIARVNRVFRDKPGGLIVDYLGLADSLKRAMADYTESGGKGDTTIDQGQAVVVFLEKLGIVRDMFHTFDYMAIVNGKPTDRLAGVVQAMDFILQSGDEGKKRYLPAVTALSKAFALAVPNEKALEARDEVRFFQEVRAALIKTTGDERGQTPDQLDAAVRQLVSRAVASTEIVDIFEVAGMEKPDISILSDEFLEEVRALPHKNLALEVLKKLINDEIQHRSRKNVVQARSFSEMLEEAVRKYQNRAIESAELIQELIRIAKEIRESRQRGEKLGLNDDEVAFYDALAENESAREVMGDKKLLLLAHLLVEKVKKSVSIDWTLRENARAQIRVLVKRILREHGYPPDMEKRATQLVLEQAEVLCKEWTVG